MMHRRTIVKRLLALIPMGMLALMSFAIPELAHADISHFIGPTRATVLASKPCPPPSKFDELTPDECKARPSPDSLCVRTAAQPNSAVMPAQIVTYRFTMINNWRGDATHARLSLAITPERQKLVDVSFSQPDAWVSKASSNELVLSFATLRPGEVATATVRMQVSSAATSGQDLLSRAQLHWEGHGRVVETLSNQMRLLVGELASDSSTVPLDINPSVAPSTAAFIVAYPGFAANERISVWYHRSNGDNTPLTVVKADALGQMHYSLSPRALSAGRYALVAYGQCSQVTATGSFTVVQ
jgi:hypothetical protein